MPPSPPSVPLPKAVQTARFIVRPISFMQHWRRELGETFAASLFGPGEVVFISDAESVKALYSRDRRPRRKLMPPPFHGERMRAYESVIAEATEDAIAGWRQGEEFALHPTMQDITLEVILRAVFGLD